MIKSILFCLGMIPLLAYSQEESKALDDLYFESMTDNLNLKLELDNDIETFEFNDDNSNYSVRPNTSLRMSIAVNHKFLTLKVGFSPKFLESDDSDKRGSTSVFKISGDIFLGNWIQTLEFSNIKGYYIEEVGDFNSFELSDDSEFILLPHLTTRTFRGITRYNFNNNFSFKAMSNQNDIQRKSAGSFLPSLTYEYFKISDKTSIQDLKSVNLILNAGYFYTGVINKKLYTNLGIAPGLGIGFNRITTEEEDNIIINRSTEFILNMNALIGLGYNSKSFFGGVLLRGIATTRADVSIIKFDSVRGIFKVFIGYRFKPPKFVNQSFDWMEDKNPLK